MKIKKISLPNLSALLVFSFLSFISCEKNDDPKGEYEHGIFIINEGAFTQNNGSVSFYSYNTDKVINNLYKSVNDKDLGDVVQSVKIHGDKAYIVVNNSNKIEMVNRYTFQEISTFTDVNSPRHLVASGNKGYVSCWGDNSVKIIDLDTEIISKSLPVGTGPEKMAISNGNLFVTNSGGWGVDSTISVIDLNTEQVTSTITVKYCPMDIEVDKNGYLWVLCKGKVEYDPITFMLIEETASKIYKIDPTNNTVSAEISLFDNQHPTTLEIGSDKSTLYLGGGFGFEGVYSLVTEGTQATSTKIINDFAYGFSFDINSNVLFILEAPSFTSSGTLKRYDADGTLLGTYAVGIGPNGTSN